MDTPTSWLAIGRPPRCVTRYVPRKSPSHRVTCHIHELTNIHGRDSGRLPRPVMRMMHTQGHRRHQAESRGLPANCADAPALTTSFDRSPALPTWGYAPAHQ